MLAAGHLRGPDGRPASGTVVAYAWPTNLDLLVGDIAPLVPVAWTRTGPDGSFTLRSAGSPGLSRLAEVNGGYINLSLEGSSAGRLGQTHLSRHLGTFRALGAWREEPGAEAPPVTVHVDEEVFPHLLAGEGNSPRHACFARWKLVRTAAASTVVGELNPEEDTRVARFTYGEGNHADSRISIAVRSRGGWASAGAHHIANSSDTGRAAKNARPSERMRIRSNFDYHLYRSECENRRRIYPHGWRGGMTSEFHQTPGCLGSPHKDEYENDTNFHRNRNEAATWGGAAEVFGASLSARSGYSRHVEVHMEFGSNPVHHVCGDDADAMHSKRVWTGIVRPGPECRPGRPC